MKSGDVFAHYVQLKIEGGESDGRFLWPFAPDLEDYEGVQQAADNVRRVLGEVVPGRVDPRTREFEVTLDQFLAKIEDLSAKMIGELVEVNVKHGAVRDDGKHFLRVYINRGLGEDSAGHKRARKQQVEPDDNLDMTPAKKRPAKKRPVKKRLVGKKKVR